MNYPRIGKKIERLRYDRGHPQKYMAQELGIQQNTYSLWEKGKGLTEERVEAIAKILKVPFEDLISPAPFELMTHNDHNSDMEMQNQQQNFPPEVMGRLMARYEAMNDRLIALLERFASK